MSAAALLSVALALVATTTPSVAAAAGTGLADPAVAASPVVVDTDMDFDDTAALAYLAEADKLGLIDLRAVAVEISGVALAGNGLSHARCLLDKVGLPQVPVADGGRTRINNFPDWARAILDGIVEAGVRTNPAIPCPTLPTDGQAADLLASAIRSAPDGVTLVTLGPLTTVAEALERDPTLATKIGRVFLIGGRLDWSGYPTSGLDTHDYNLWVDAPAAQAVLEALPNRTFVTGHEATDFVPLTEAFRQRLATDRTTPAVDTVFTMASHPLLISAEADNQTADSPGIAYWWDPLDAVAATVGGIVSHRPTRISVVQTGEYEGRTFVDDNGPLVHYGTAARTDTFEQTFLDILNARYPQES